MKRIVPSSSRGLLLVYRILAALLLLLVAAVIGGSVYALARPKGSAPVLSLGVSKSGDAAEAVALPRSGGGGSATGGGATAVFSGIGRLRIPVAAYPPAGSAIMILSVAFPYPPDDGPFTEELASHIGDFRGIATDYFSSLAADKIVRLDEGAAKAEILRRYNALLRLGKITALYFNDLMIVE